MPSAGLSSYITTYYHLEVDQASQEGVTDWLHPEWGNVRFGLDGDLEAAVGSSAIERVPAFVAVGPTTRSTRFTIRRGRFWGIGLLPLGWAKFVDASAYDYADRFCDASGDPAFANFAPLLDTLYDGVHDLEAEAARIDRHLRDLAGLTIKDEEMVKSVHAAMVDPTVSTVMALSERAGMTSRTLERFSRKTFGFPPKLLLRRQRFLRSLAQYMLDPSLSWFSALDYHYHDQSHFVRDFKRFMSMTPNQYRKLPHPILMAAARARAEAAGEAVQGLHSPHGSHQT